MRRCSSTARLQEARRVVSETEEIGLAVLDRLHEQRETLLRTLDKAREVNTLTDRGKWLLRRMIVRSRASKFLLWLIILILTASFFALLYFGFLRKN